MNFNRAHIATLIRCQETLGLPTPEGIAEAHRNVAKIADASATLNQPIDLAPIVAQAIVEDRDPATDPAVTRALAARELAGLTHRLEQEAQHRLVAAIRNNRDHLYESWKKAADKAGKTLAAEYQALGNVDLTTDAARILNRGGDIAAHFVTARDANQTIETVLEAHYALEGITGNTVSRDYRNLWLTPATLDQWEAHELVRRVTAWDLVKAGFTINLATPTEIRARIQTHADARAERERKAHDKAVGRRDDLAGILK